MGRISRDKCGIEGSKAAALTAGRLAMSRPGIGWIAMPNRQGEPAPGIYRRRRGGTTLETTVRRLAGGDM